jgi:hypothetical protein
MFDVTCVIAWTLTLGPLAAVCAWVAEAPIAMAQAATNVVRLNNFIDTLLESSGTK